MGILRITVSLKIVGLVIGLLFALTGCSKKTKNDPFEPLNRSIYGFNRIVDKLYINPMAQVYMRAVPPPAQDSVGNFIDNIFDVPSAANNFLQGKGKKAATSIARVVVNSTLGMFGLFDVATEMGLGENKEDFGQTLMHWGYKESSYLVLPILGPSTIRDTVGRVVSVYMKPTYYFKPKWRNRFLAMTLVHKRSVLAENEDVIEVAGVDEYSFIRDAYLQRRQYLSGDGEDYLDGDDLLGEPPE